MAKLSDLFGRKGLAGPDKLTDGRNGNGGDPISIENLSDVGSRMGEENEVLRNLLTDTGARSANSTTSRRPSTSWWRRSTARCAPLNRKNRRP